MFLAEEAEKEFTKLRDKYVRARKALQTQSCYSQTESSSSFKAVSRAQEKYAHLQYLNWLDEYIKPRKPRIEQNESDLDDINSIDVSIEYESEDDVKFQIPGTMKNEMKRKALPLPRQSGSDVEKIEMTMQHSVSEINKRDNFDLFGEYVATKMRKLNRILNEDDMESVEHEITTVLLNARSRRAPLPTQSWMSIYNNSMSEQDKN